MCNRMRCPNGCNYPMTLSVHVNDRLKTLGSQCNRCRFVVWSEVSEYVVSHRGRVGLSEHLRLASTLNKREYQYTDYVLREVRPDI